MTPPRRNTFAEKAAAHVALVLALAVAVLIALPAAAVKPGQWNHQTEADFAKGETENAIVTSLGEIQLSRAAETIAQVEGDDSIIYDLIRLNDGTLIAALGPVGRLAKLNDDKLEIFAEYTNEQIFAIAASDAGLYVAVSGAKSRIEVRSGDDLAVTETIELPETRYVWDIHPRGGSIWLATGTEGKVLRVDTADADGEEAVIRTALDSAHPNILTLGFDAQGRAYAGTDGEGLVYRITEGANNTFDTFILYDAAEPEIGAILVEPNGTVYVGTADAEQARPGRLEKAIAEPTGRIEKTEEPPAEPHIPQVPPRPDPSNPAAEGGTEAGAASDVATATDPAAAGASEAAEGNDEADAPAAEAPPVDAPTTEAPAATAEAADPAAPSETPADTPAAPPAEAASTTPTPEQYEQLRQTISQRLDEAGSGRVQLQSASGGGGSAIPTSRPRTRATTARSGAASQKGNAIYRISSQGFVSEVFRESVMILRLAKIGDRLLIATGNEGQLYSLDVAADEVAQLIDLEPKQVPALLTQPDGSTLIGTANPARLLSMANSFSNEGTFLSQTLDAAQISLWGKLQITANLPDVTGVEVQTRSGNVGDPDNGSWSGWSDLTRPDFDGTGVAYLDVTAPTARFLQYRLMLRSDGRSTPVVQRIALKYLVPNLRPKIASIKSAYSTTNRPNQPPQAQSTLKIEWESEDPNSDSLRYKVEARRLNSNAPFLLVAENITDKNHEWDTRTSPDGRYIVRLTASDALDNVPDQALTATRLSDPIVIDNTPPDITNIEASADGSTVTITASVADAFSEITEVRYVVPAKDPEAWQIILPQDLIYDSTREDIVVKIADLPPGRHAVSIRATDAQGNSRYVTTVVETR